MAARCAWRGGPSALAVRSRRSVPGSESSARADRRALSDHCTRVRCLAFPLLSEHPGECACNEYQEGEPPMDALKLLETDHQEVKKLMGEIEKTTERGVKTRQQLFTKLVQELTIHEKIEEQIFYPRVKEQAKTKKLEELVTESFEEHHFVDVVKAEIESTPFEAEEWAAKFKVMMENIEHHAFEEEEGKMFPQVRKIFSKTELE